ncbi:MAG: HAD-IA family hydrolase [bacterium]
MKFEGIKLVSLDIFDTTLIIKKNNWMQEVAKYFSAEQTALLDPANLRHRFLCDNVSMIATLQSLNLLRDEHVSDIQQLIDAECASIEPVLFAKEILEEITQAHNYKLAVISNLGYDYGKPALAALNHSIDYTLFSYEVGYKKPDQEIFQKLITLSGLQPYEILHIGNSYKNDYLGAKEAGMHAIHLDLQRTSIADAKISTIAELVHYL